MSDIHLVSMPFAPIEWPSIGIALLAGAARKEGLDTRANYPYFRFAETIGLRMYSLVSSMVEPDVLLGEWIFSQCAFSGYGLPDDPRTAIDLTGEVRLRHLLRVIFGKTAEDFMEDISDLRKKASDFVKKTAANILSENPRIVGCTTSFLQYSSSLALLREIKHLDDSVVTILGGANCEAEMGYITQKKFGWVDFVVSGEADILFPKLCKKILEQGPVIEPGNLPLGVYNNEKARFEIADIQEHTETAIVENLDDISLPDYSDFFDELNKSGFSDILHPPLLMETSRGCFKGEKNACSFCALNGSKMTFRTKSTRRILWELETLTASYQCRSFFMTDMVLHLKRFENLFLELGNREAPFNLYFETMPSLTENQVQSLSRAGVRWLQIGIESLHVECLKLLNKKNSPVRSVAVLKHALENDLKISWNIICGIPGDRDAYYIEMADILPLLFHLEPPVILFVRLDRFSQYYENPSRFGLDIQPLKKYKYIYPFTSAELQHAAYFFEDKSARLLKKTRMPGIRRIGRVISKWRSSFYANPSGSERPVLLEDDFGDCLHIRDTRLVAVSTRHSLSGLERDVYISCRHPVPMERVFNLVKSEDSKEKITKTLESLIEKKLIIYMGNRYLALGTRATGSRVLFRNAPDELLRLYASQNVILKSGPKKVTSMDWLQDLSMPTGKKRDA